MSEDDRVRCIDCARLVSGCCTSPKRAGLFERFGKCEIGPQLAALPQRCPAFAPIRVRQPAQREVSA